MYKILMRMMEVKCEILLKIMTVILPKSKWIWMHCAGKMQDMS